MISAPTARARRARIRGDEPGDRRAQRRRDSHMTWSPMPALNRRKIPVAPPNWSIPPPRLRRKPPPGAAAAGAAAAGPADAPVRRPKPLYPNTRSSAVPSVLPPIHGRSVNGRRSTAPPSRARPRPRRPRRARRGRPAAATRPGRRGGRRATARAPPDQAARSLARNANPKNTPASATAAPVGRWPAAWPSREYHGEHERAVGVVAPADRHDHWREGEGDARRPARRCGPTRGGPPTSATRPAARRRRADGSRSDHELKPKIRADSAWSQNAPAACRR